jgi:transcriptional regulator with XRE-family HTH domain
MGFATRFKTAMTLHGMTMNETAKACHVSRQTLKNWIDGSRIDLDHFLCACEVLNVRVFWLRLGKGRLTPHVRDPQLSEAAQILSALPPEKAKQWLANGHKLVEKELSTQRSK